jgi:replicative DNA helicase
MNIEHKFIASLILSDDPAPALAGCKPEWLADPLARKVFDIALEHGAEDIIPKIYEFMPGDAGRVVAFLDLAEAGPQRMIGAIRSAHILRAVESAVASAGKHASGPERLIVLRESLENIADEALRLEVGNPFSRAIEALQTGARAIRTHIPGIDHNVKMRPGNMVVIAARPRTGKTAMGTTIARMMTRRARTVDFYSAEMDDVEILARIAASSAMIENSRIIGHGDPETPRESLTPEEFESVVAVYRQMEQEGRLRVVNAAGMHAGEIAHRIATSSAEVAIVDYIQLIEGDTSGTREQEVASVSRSLKRAAMRGRKLVIALAQLNRSVENEKRRPQLSDLRESGAIEQDADSVLLMHVNTHDTRQTESFIDSVEAAGAADIPVEVIVAKARHGRAGIITLRFDKRTQRFYEQEMRMPTETRLFHEHEPQF